MPLRQQTYLRGIAWAVLAGGVLIALTIPVRGCFPDTGSCLTISALRGKAGFSEYWTWDYRWPFRIMAVLIGGVTVLCVYAVTSRSKRSGD